MPQNSQISQFKPNKVKSLTLMDGFHGNQRPQPILCFYAKLTTRGNKLITTYLWHDFHNYNCKEPEGIVLYHSADCIGYGYAELEHGCIIFHRAEALGNKFEHGIKMVMVNSVSWTTWVPNALYHVSMLSASWFLRRWYLKVFTIYGHECHHGHVTRIIWTNFQTNIPCSRSIWNLASNRLMFCF